MLRKILTVLSVGCVCGAAGVAGAADFPVKASPLAAVYDWSGFYVGGHAGYARQATSAKFGSANTGGDAFLADGRMPSSLSLNAYGGLGGVQIGLNRQSGTVVWGIEADISALALNGSAVARTAAPPISYLTTANSKLDALGTLRGRIGFTPLDRSLLYVTGGLAYGHADVSSSFTTSMGGVVFCGTIGICASKMTSTWQAGWTLGAGWEQALGMNWSLKLEYLYYDLGSVRHGIADPASPTGPGFDTSVGLRGHIARAGVNYKF